MRTITLPSFGIESTRAGHTCAAEKFHTKSVSGKTACLLIFLAFTPRKTKTSKVLNLIDPGSSRRDISEAPPHTPVRFGELETDSVTVKQKKR
ncbi:hypothetical protein E5288_WYG008795 [Bos mutus]|uniref:Uncharacterized protein n=1 Tax=Bos mutus TaxID=72004 RepID=A0A6B0RIU5_9CETA|nr:hypothetical protein [Bos mutus]